MIKGSALSLVAFALALLPSVAFGQIQPDLQMSGVSYHTYYSEGELTMQVFVVSSTSGTGIYEIGTDTRMMELITLAGFAPPPRTSRSSNRITITLMRPSAGNATVYQARIEDFVMEPERHPPLQEGDVILLESVQKQKFGWRDAVSITSGLSAMLLLAGRLGLINFRR